MRLSQLAVALAALLAVQSAMGELVIESAERKIAASTQRVVADTKLTIKNTGSQAEEGVVLCEPAALREHAAMYEVGLTSGGSTEPLSAAPASPAGAPASLRCESVAHSLAPGATADLVVRAVYTHVLEPHPEAIPPSQPQRVELAVPAVLASPYRVAKQTTVLELGTSKVEAYTKEGLEPVALKSGKLTYGPYTDKEPFADTGATIDVHYENNSPFAEAKRVVREIEISHWGNVYFEERYTLANNGAKIKGEWSRFDYMSSPDYGRSAVRDLSAVLMPGARSLYFRDSIGNISSSAAREQKDGVVVILMPRFPLFGGWSTEFLFGWSMPLPGTVARTPEGIYSLVTLIGPAIQDLVVDELEVRVVLPEGATFEGVDSKLDLDVSFDKKITYFDITGRTVVVLRKSNVVPEMNVPFTLVYRYPLSAMAQKPLLLVAAFGVLFTTLVVVSRSSFGINGKGKGKEKTS